MSEKVKIISMISTETIASWSEDFDSIDEASKRYDELENNSIEGLNNVFILINGSVIKTNIKDIKNEQNS